jgi:hypothetical protein
MNGYLPLAVSGGRQEKPPFSLKTHAVVRPLHWVIRDVNILSLCKTFGKEVV